jgi:hypothetical protein
LRVIHGGSSLCLLSRIILRFHSLRSHAAVVNHVAVLIILNLLLHLLLHGLAVLVYHRLLHLLLRLHHWLTLRLCVLLLHLRLHWLAVLVYHRLLILLLRLHLLLIISHRDRLSPSVLSLLVLLKVFSS